jgi:hypothetical protein
LSVADIITGLDLSVMSEDVFNDAVMDIVGSDTVMSEPYMIKVRLQILTLPRAHARIGYLPWGRHSQTAGV